MNDQWLSLVLELSHLGKFSNKDLAKLRGFYTAQQALSRELQAAKSLGTCKTIGSTSMIGDAHLSIRSVEKVT